MQRAALPLLVLVVLAFTVWLLWTTRPQTQSQPAPTPVPDVAAADTPAAASEAPPGFRLAGLAVGDPQSYAAIELPDGSSHLYRVDSDVPGLGRVVAITNAGAAIEGEHGKFTLKLKPAATPTPDRRRINGEAGNAATTPSARPDDRGDKAAEPAV
jgi:hypothetical protein